MSGVKQVRFRTNYQKVHQLSSVPNAQLLPWPHHQLSHLSEIYTINTPRIAHPTLELTSAARNRNEIAKQAKCPAARSNNEIKCERKMWSEINLMQILPFFFSLTLGPKQRRANRKRDEEGTNDVGCDVYFLIRNSCAGAPYCVCSTNLSMFPCLLKSKVINASGSQPFFFWWN